MVPLFVLFKRGVSWSSCKGVQGVADGQFLLRVVTAFRLLVVSATTYRRIDSVKRAVFLYRAIGACPQ